MKTTAEIIAMMKARQTIECALMALRHENTSDAVALLSEAIKLLRWRDKEVRKPLCGSGECLPKEFECNVMFYLMTS